MLEIITSRCSLFCSHTTLHALCSYWQKTGAASAASPTAHCDMCFGPAGHLRCSEGGHCPMTAPASACRHPRWSAWRCQGRPAVPGGHTCWASPTAAWSPAASAQAVSIATAALLQCLMQKWHRVLSLSAMVRRYFGVLKGGKSFGQCACLCPASCKEKCKERAKQLTPFSRWTEPLRGS